MKESAGKDETEMVHRPGFIWKKPRKWSEPTRPKRGKSSTTSHRKVAGQKVAGHKIESETGDVQPRKCRQVAGHDASSWSKTASPHCTAERDKQSIPAKREGNDGPLFPLEDSEPMVNLSAKRYTVLDLPAASSSVSRDDDVQPDHAWSVPRF
ncbi:hypothetical protein NDA10_006365 [Ustilago hordei]|nr:hypothetical protein NDA10_006365 [Ustilago hordei]